jgi:3-hydroxyisobutyrate dehydrogenase/2-hydroxy-3-oxopropionate reductase
LDRLAFLGTGLMGAPMAARLIAAGHTVNLWNRATGKLKSLAGEKGIVFASPAEAASQVDFVCLCLTDAAAVEMVLFGPRGVLKTISTGAIIIDFSTIGREATLSFARRMALERGVAWLDCPVSGGVAGAQAGTLSIFTGGEPAALERAKSLLATLAGRVTYMGGVGAGQSAKLCNQLIVATNMLAIAEAMHLGEALGIDISKLPGALQGGFADSRPLQLFGDRMAPAEDPGLKVSELRTMYKDIDAIRREASAAAAPTPLLDRVNSLYGSLIEAGFGSDDVPGLMRLYRENLAPTARAQ